MGDIHDRAQLVADDVGTLEDAYVLLQGDHATALVALELTAEALEAAETDRNAAQDLAASLAGDLAECRASIPPAPAPVFGYIGANFPTFAGTIERVYRPHAEQQRLRDIRRAGRKVAVSVKPSLHGCTLQDVVNATDAARDMFRFLRQTLSAEDDVAMHHEPENDGINPDTYRAASEVFHARVTRRIGARAVVCTMNSWPTNGNDSPWDYGGADVLAADLYNVFGVQSGYRWRSMLDLATPVARYADARGKKAAVWECGTTPEGVSDPWPDATTMWWDDAVNAAEVLKLDALVAFRGTGPRGTWKPDIDAMYDATIGRDYWEVPAS